MDTSEIINVIRDIESPSFSEGLSLALSDFKIRTAHAHTLTTTHSGTRFTYRLTTSIGSVPAKPLRPVIRAVLDEISSMVDSGAIVAVSYCVKGEAVSLLLDTQ